MTAANIFIAPHKIDRVSRELSSELGSALDTLSGIFHYEFECPTSRRNVSPRDYAEWREAKTLVSHLKYPDPAEPVRAEDMGWALGRVLAYPGLTVIGWAPVLEKVAKILGIDLSRPHPIPRDLQRKINNELQLAPQGEAAMAVAVAAA